MVKKSKLGLAVFASLAISSCSNFIDGLVLESPTLSNITSKYVERYDLEARLLYENIDFSNNVILLVHGFAGNSETWGSLENPDSPISVATRYYGNNVIIAEYPTSMDVSSAASSILEKVQDIANSQIDIVAHSMGGLVARSMVRQNPDLFRSVGLIASPHNGMDLGLLIRYLERRVPRYVDYVFNMNDLEATDSDYLRVKDLFPGSYLLSELNSPVELSSKPTYHFFIFSKTNGTLRLIPGEDDSLLSPRTTNPTSLITSGNFEPVDPYSLITFYGDVRHMQSIHNPEIMDLVFRTVNVYASMPRTFQDSVVYEIPESHPNEQTFR